MYNQKGAFRIDGLLKTGHGHSLLMIYRKLRGCSKRDSITIDPKKNGRCQQGKQPLTQ
jgi:hypothetical protein